MAKSVKFIQQKILKHSARTIFALSALNVC